MPIRFPPLRDLRRAAMQSASQEGTSRPIGAYAPYAGKPPEARQLRCFAWFRAFGVVLALVVISACRHDPPEQALRKTIATMQAAAEAGDTDALFAPIAEDFAGSEAMDRQAFRRYVTVLRLRNARVSVTLGPIAVKLYGNRASADFSAALAGGAGLLPEHARIYNVSTGWRLEGSQWKLISARWDDQP